ncbi:ORF6N domain-containing protein [Desulfoplanes sp. PS50]|jgi:hypothetical protein
MDIVKFEHVGSKILDIRGRKVILDSDLAELYGVETKRINEAVKNNPDRFLDDYITELTLDEKKQLVENFDRFNRLKHSSVLPKAFTEKGLYMMATILKSPQAVQTTIAIIEAFARLRELSRNIQTLSTVKDEQEQQSLMQKSGEIISEIFDNDLQTSDTETSFEINFAVLKFKHLIKKKVK